METVTIGCRLPSGYVIEVGYQTNVQGAGGSPYAMYRKLSDYQSYTLKGLNQRSFLRGPDGKIMSAMPSARGREPFINTGVPKDLWDRWCKENRDNWALTSGQIFEIPKNDAATVKAVTTDAKAKSPAIFEPIDHTQPMKVDGMEIAKRADDDYL